MARILAIEPLTKAAFAPFGDVVEREGHTPITINEGYANRVNGLGIVDVMGDGAIVNLSIFVAKKRPAPLAIRMMERHPFGSQMFYPLQDREWLVVVCADPHAPESYRAFRASGRQGVNYARNVWHHPLLVLSDDERFMVVDRGNNAATPLNNLEEIWLEPDHCLTISV